MHQVRHHGKYGGVSFYIGEAFNFKVEIDLSFNTRDLELLSVEILFDKRCNILVNVLCRPPSSLTEPFENFLKDIFSKTKNSSTINTSYCEQF